MRSAAAAEKAVSAQTAAAAVAAPGVPVAPPAPVPPLKPAEPKTSAWTGVVGLGLIALTGNSQALTFKGNGAFERKTEEWIYGFKANAQYGQARAAGATDTLVSAMAAEAQLRGDRRLSQQLSVFLLAGILADHVKSIEERPYAEAGVSLIWFDTKEGGLQKSTLKTDLGFRYGREYRFAYYPTPGRVDPSEVDIIAPHAGLSFRYAVNKDIIFTQDLDVVPNLVGETRLLLNSLSKLAARLSESVSLGISYGIAYDSVPPDNTPAHPKLNTDTALTIGLEVAL